MDPLGVKDILIIFVCIIAIIFGLIFYAVNGYDEVSLKAVLNTQLKDATVGHVAGLIIMAILLYKL